MMYIVLVADGKPRLRLAYGTDLNGLSIATHDDDVLLRFRHQTRWKVSIVSIEKLQLLKTGITL